MNLTFNVADAADQHAIRVAVLFLLTALSVLGLSLYSIYTVIVLCNRKNVFFNSFYLFTLGCALPDCLFLVVTLVYEVPYLATGHSYWPSWFERAAGYSAAALYGTISGYVLIISINRYIAVARYAEYVTYFTLTRTTVYLVLPWIPGVVLCSANYFCGCYISYQQYFWQHQCESYDNDSVHITNGLSVCASVLVPAAVLITNILTYTKYRQTLKGSRTLIVTRPKRNERSMFLQVLAISGILLIYVLWFWLHQTLLDEQSWASALTNLLAIMNSSLNPIFYIILNPEVRKRLPWKKLGDYYRQSNKGYTNNNWLTDNCTTKT